MKRLLLIVLVLSLGGCAVADNTTRPASAPSARGADALLQQWPGTWDNHAQVWQAGQVGKMLVPVHVRQRIRAVPDHDRTWDWRLTRLDDAGEAQRSIWRYVASDAADGTLVLTPWRPLPGQKDDTQARWAELVPCALRGGMQQGHLHLEADKAACRAIIGGLGTHAALLPLILDFDGKRLKTQTYSDVARGADAREVALRVRWYQAWVAINGAGPQAESGDKDWHMQRKVRIGNQGLPVAIRWRDGTPSGYALRLDTRDYQKRGIRVLQLSLVRSDGASMAYAWADPDSRHIGLNLGWLQTGLQQAGQGD